MHTFLYFTGKLKLAQVAEGGTILIAFLMGLFFFSFNKILLNIYYSFKNTWIPTIITILATVINYMLNIALMKIFMATGIAMATTISAVLQTIFLLIFLYLVFGVRFYFVRFLEFLARYSVQLFVVFFVFYYLYKAIFKLFSCLSPAIGGFFITGVGFWLWIGPLSIMTVLVIYYTRKLFKVNVYFID